MVPWVHTFDLQDVFHNEELTFEQKREAIHRRLTKQPWFEDFDNELGISADIKDTEDVDEWDFVWDQFYDWCDDNRVWVRTV